MDISKSDAGLSEHCIKSFQPPTRHQHQICGMLHELVDWVCPTTVTATTEKLLLTKQLFSLHIRTRTTKM